MSDESQVTIPEVSSFEQMRARAVESVSQKGKPRTALVVPSESQILQAFDRAITEELIDPYVIGDETLARKKFAELNCDPDTVRFIDTNEPDLAIRMASKMAAGGELDLIVKGRVTTVAFLKLLFDDGSMFKHGRQLVSHVAVLKPRAYRKLLFLTDAAITIEPDLNAKIGLINNAVRVAHQVGVETPRVAVLAAVEVIYPQMPVTMDAAILGKMSERGQFKNAFVDGPLSFDVAIDMAAAHAKGIRDSAVAGQADILLAPNIETANGIYKAVSLYCEADVAGVIVGGQVPVALSSRADSPVNKFHSIVLGVVASTRS